MDEACQHRHWGVHGEWADSGIPCILICLGCGMLLHVRNDDCVCSYEHQDIVQGHGEDA